MTSYLQILGEGDDCSVLLIFGNQKYIFNCPEGTQRLCIASKVKLARLKTVFLTSSRWHRCGGLFGFLLTMLDARGDFIPDLRSLDELKQSDALLRKIASFVRLLAPGDAHHLLACSRYFVARKTLLLHLYSFADHCLNSSSSSSSSSDAAFDFVDGGVRVRAFSFSPPRVDAACNDELAHHVDAHRRRPLLGGQAHASDDVLLGIHRRRWQMKKDENDARATYYWMRADESIDSVLASRQLQVTNRHNKAKGPKSHKHVQRLQPNAKKRGRWESSSSSLSTTSTWTSPLLANKKQRCASTTRMQHAKEGFHCRMPPIPRLEHNDDVLAIDAVCCYAVHAPDKPGKFNVARAKELGVPPGPMYGQLVRGNSVALADGAVVTPLQCVAASTRGAVVLVVECPSDAHAALLVDCERLRRLYQDGDAAVRVACVVHLTPERLVDDARYRAWMLRFGVDTTHMVSNRTRRVARPLCDRWARHLVKLNQVHSSIFSLPAPAEQRNGDRAHIDAEHLLRFSLSPTPGIDTSALLEPMTASAAIDDDKTANGGSDFAVHFLGTGSAAPALLRNVSGILLTLPNGCMLLDAGEGSWAQMMRRFGSERAAQLLLSMHCVVITHMHADHHMGLVMVLRERTRLAAERSMTPPPLPVVGPTSMLYFLTEWCAIESLHFRFVDCEDVLCTLAPSKRRFDDVFANCSLRIGAVSVVHCPSAYGFVIERLLDDDDDGALPPLKLVYSGDTRPCQSLVDHGRDADLLIHEATFEHDMLADAVAKRHSTATEAIEVAQQMGARATILTHFSQRYPTIPAAVIEHVRDINVSLAFDLMSARRSDLELLPSLVADLAQALQEEQDEQDEQDDDDDDDDDYE
jgi:ribonuclease Z